MLRIKISLIKEGTKGDPGRHIEAMTICLECSITSNPTPLGQLPPAHTSVLWRVCAADP